MPECGSPFFTCHPSRPNYLPRRQVLFAARRNGEGPIRKKPHRGGWACPWVRASLCNWFLVVVGVLLLSAHQVLSLSNLPLPSLSPPRSLSSTLRSTSKRQSLHPDFFPLPALPFPRKARQLAPRRSLPAPSGPGTRAHRGQCSHSIQSCCVEAAPSQSPAAALFVSFSG
jgi:hypothetical protein